MINILKVKDWLKKKEEELTVYSYHGIDAGAELTRMLTEEIYKEIIRETLKLGNHEKINYK